MRALLASTVLCLGLFGQFTVLPPPGAGGGVGGASNLTTAGAVPYVASPGVLMQDSGLNWLTATSTLAVGANATSGDTTSFLAKSAQTLLLASGGAHGFRDESTYIPAGGGSGGYASYDAIPAYSGSGAQNHLHSFQSRPNYSGSGTIDQIAGLTFQPTTSGGTATTVAAVVVTDADGAGAITTQYGLLVKPLTRGASNYGVFVQGSNPSYFGGNVQSGGTVSGTAMRISTGFTTYGGVITHDASGNFLSNPNLTIVNGVLTLANGATSKVLASATNLILESTSGAVTFNPSAAERARFTATTGNLLIGTTTDGNYKLDIAASGSSGTLRVFNQSAGGSTLVNIQAGDTQSGDLTQWKDNAGSVFARVGNGGSFETATAVSIAESASAVRIYNAGILKWSGTSSFAGTADLSLSRDTASIMQLGDGGANANGWLKLRGVQPTGITVTGLPTASAYPGMIVQITDANATTIGSTVAGGGSNKVLVWSNGTDWKIFAN